MSGRLLGYDLSIPIPINVLGIRQSFELQSLMYAYYPGEPDGVLGPMSRDAYKQLKKGWGFTEDILIDNATVDKLRQEWVIRFKPTVSGGSAEITTFDNLGVTFVQFCLGKRYEFAIDGMVGPLTESALFAWKEANGATQNLIMTQAQLDQIGAEFGSGAAFR